MDWRFLATSLVGLTVSAVLTRTFSVAMHELLRVGYSATVLLAFAHLQLQAREVVTGLKAWTPIGGCLAALGLAGYVAVVVFGYPPNTLAFPNSAHLGEGFVRLAGTMASNAFVLYLSVALGLAFAAHSWERSSTSRCSSAQRSSTWARGAGRAL